MLSLFGFEQTRIAKLARKLVSRLEELLLNRNRTLTTATEKLARDLDNLTPLDARNSLLLSPEQQRKIHSRDVSEETLPTEPFGPYHDDPSYRGAGGFRDNINLGERRFRNERTASPNPSMRAPLLPQVDASYRSRGY